MRDADGQPGHGALAQPGAARPGRSGGRWPGALCATASWPTSRRPSSSSPGCRAGTGMTGRSPRSCDSIRRRKRSARRSTTRESRSWPSARSSSASRSSSRSCCRRAGPACPAPSAAIRPSTAAAVASSAGCGSSRSSCSSCSSSSRWSPSSSRPDPPPDRRIAAAHRDRIVARSSMTRTDSFVVGTLVVAARDPRGPRRRPGAPDPGRRDRPPRPERRPAWPSRVRTARACSAARCRSAR